MSRRAFTFPLRSALPFVLAVSLSFPFSAGAANILFVSDTTSDGEIATVLTADGHTVTVVTNDYGTGNATLKGDLSGYQAVFWSTSQKQHSDAALITALTDWVSSGGRLFVTGADGVAPSYNASSGFWSLLGASGGHDGGYGNAPIASAPNAITTGVIDIRGRTPPDLSDGDSICGPFAAGLVQLVHNTTGVDPGCPDQSSWTLRPLGSGLVAWVAAGNWASDVDNTDPDWSSTAIPGDGVYNAAIRNFAFNAEPAAVPAIPVPALDRTALLLLLTALACAAVIALR